MDIYTKFNRSDIQDRQIDTLIGLSKGVIADGVINQAEAEFLHTWLIQNGYSENPIILNLLRKISFMLEDKSLDKDEASELLSTMREIAGEKSVLGELSKTAKLPVCVPPPSIVFEDRSFLCTGTFAYGTRKQCQEAISSRGGFNAKSVTKKLDYLILGTYVTDSWAHESFGRKIEQAMKYRDSGIPISIVTEEYWLKEACIEGIQAS